MTKRLFGRILLQKDLGIESKLRKLPKPLEEGRTYDQIGEGGNCVVNLKFYEGRLIVAKIPNPKDTTRIAPVTEILMEEFSIMKGAFPNSKGRIPKPIALLEDEDENVELLLELIEYPTVKDLIKQGGLNELEKASLLIECANAITEAAHDNRVIHRDIKEANLMIGQRVKLIDFGSAKVLGENDKIAQIYPFGRLGTVEYRAPEITSSGTSSFKSDIYAFGIMMHYILGGNPFYQMDYDQILRWHRETKPQEIQTPAWPIIKSCLEKDPKKRPEDMRSVRDGLGEEFERAKIKIPKFYEE